MNSGVLVVKKKDNLSRVRDGRHSSVPVPSVKRPTLKIAVHVNYKYSMQISGSRFLVGLLMLQFPGEVYLQRVPVEKK